MNTLCWLQCLPRWSIISKGELKKSFLTKFIGWCLYDKCIGCFTISTIHVCNSHSIFFFFKQNSFKLYLFYIFCLEFFIFGIHIKFHNLIVIFVKFEFETLLRRKSEHSLLRSNMCYIRVEVLKNEPTHFLYINIFNSLKG